MKKYLTVLLVFLVVWLAGCSNPLTPDSPKVVLELDWTNKSDDSDSLSAMRNDFEPAAIDTNLKYGHQLNTSGGSISQIEASLVDENGKIIPDATFEYQLSETPTYIIDHTQGNLIEVAFTGFGKGVLTVMATTDTETISGDFEYKVIATGFVQTTHFDPEDSAEFDLEEGINAKENGDIICIENILHSPYGFSVQLHDGYFDIEEFEQIKDITSFDYANTGALWEGNDLSDANKRIFFLRTRNGGYVKLYVKGLFTVPMGCSFKYEYSPDGIFE